MTRQGEVWPVLWACLLLTVGGCAQQPPDGQPGPDKASGVDALAAVPDVAWRTLDGAPEPASKYRGQVVVIDFWATWCGPCKVAIPDLNDLYAQYRSQGLVIVGVSVDKTEASTVKAFADQFKMAYPVVMADRSVEEAFGQVMSPPQNRVTSLPTTFVVNRDGKIVKSYVGYRANVSRQNLEEDIKEWL